MRKSLSIRILITISISLLCLLSLLSSCENNGENKIDANKMNKSASSLAKNEVIKVPNDTMQFERLADLTIFFKKQIDSLDALKVEAYKSNYIDSIQSIESFYHNCIKKRNNSIYKFIITQGYNSESLDGFKYLLFDWKVPITLLDSLFNQFPDTLQNSKLGKWCFGLIEKRKIAETLSHFNLAILDHGFIDTEGKILALNQISSKYILLDFWASWCAPCRYENRILTKEKDLITSSTDISIIAISLDNNKNKWLQASISDSLNYLNLCDFNAFESPIAKELEITTIPYNVIITKDGKILANNLWGSRLTEFIKSLP